MPKGPKPLPVRVRGREFLSAKTCAKHFGISVNSVYCALCRGRPDSIGLGRKRPGNGNANMCKAKPFKLGGMTWPSRTAAARALGYSNLRTFRTSLARYPGAVLRRAMVYQARIDQAALKALQDEASAALPRGISAKIRSPRKEWGAAKVYETLAEAFK